MRVCVFACVFVFVYLDVCLCEPACVRCTTDQQTICSSPLNEQSKQQESRLSPNLESLYCDNMDPRNNFIAVIRS
ncbi:hypothetical protein ILYODFUR_008802 [Ilyodon furcidens]|uniref:Secreted protein n=1 Tax=Ilyodon furcidens TaxID=33524 RepID=A0ABV0UQ87_9TELE